MSSAAAAKTGPRDHVRETLETLVFVVVLVLILQLFVLEAFVIPTGSMAETQLGYHKNVVCQQCKYAFPVNCSDEVEKPSRETFVYGYTCPNCQNVGLVDWNGRVTPTSGDRVLVHKAMSPDDRGRVVVFKYPVAPQKKQQAQNYIKRCVGFGEETIAIAGGDLYVTKSLTYKDRPRADSRDLWQEQFTYPRDPEALTLFSDSRAKGFPAGVGGFELYRKSDELAMEMRRIVFDNDFQAADLYRRARPRWSARVNEGNGWAAEDPAAPKVFSHRGDGLGWIGYSHLSHLRFSPDEPVRLGEFAPSKPQRITNSMAYNGGLGYPFGDDGDVTRLRPLKTSGGAEDYWVGDLMLECTARFESGSEVTLELSKGIYRYRATFANGQVSISRYEAGTPGGQPTLTRSLPVGWRAEPTRPTRITGAGVHRLRFANFDCRLRVWVDDKPIDFEGESDYSPEESDFAEKHPNNTEAPAGVGAKGDVTISSLKLWRDTYYTPQRGSGDMVETYYIHPGHFLCLGDNSAQSSDGRSWGTVPERLMIGRAVFTFFPIHRIGVIR